MSASFLKELISHAVREPVTTVQYSQLDEFDRLWRELAVTASWQLPWSTIVLLWDGTPPRDSAQDQLRPQDWLTPWDWALAMSLHLCQQRQRIPQEGFRCLIMDLLPPMLGSAGRQRFKRAYAFVPWIRWYRPLSTSRPAAATYEQFFSDLAQLPNSVPLLDPQAVVAQDLEALGQTWSAMLAAPGDRHAISNLIGPIVLAEGIEQVTGGRVDLSHDPMPSHLRTLLRGSGLVSSPAEVGTALSMAMRKPLVNDDAFFPHGNRDVFERFRQVRFLLLDDQHSLGYHDVVAALLFGTRYETADSSGGQTSSFTEGGRHISLQSVAHPSLLLTALQATFDIGELRGVDGGVCPYCLEASRPDPAKVDVPRFLGGELCEILLLDLRLFVHSEDEKEYLKQLLAFYHQSGACRLGDPHLKEAARGAAARASGGEENLHALTLLPLLLSHADPSLPIVLFSSTQQRTIVAALSPRPNIITTFGKPLVSGYWSGHQAGDYVADLTEAIGSALRLHEARIVWKRIVELHIGDPPSFQVKPPASSDWLTYKANDPAYPAQFRLSHDKLRGLLADYYQDYLMAQRYYDFSSIPWELLEGSLMPEAVLQDPHWVGADLRFDYDEARQRLGASLRLCRHRKVHGFALPELAKAERARVSAQTWALLEFLVLLDVVSGTKHNIDHRESASLYYDLSTLYKHRYPELRKEPKVLDPTRLVADGNLTWEEYVVFAFAWATMQRWPSPPNPFLPLESRQALVRTAQQLFQFEKPIDWPQEGFVYRATSRRPMVQGPGGRYLITETPRFLQGQAVSFIGGWRNGRWEAWALRPAAAVS